MQPVGRYAAGRQVGMQPAARHPGARVSHLETGSNNTDIASRKILAAILKRRQPARKLNQNQKQSISLQVLTSSIKHPESSFELSKMLFEELCYHLHVAFHLSRIVVNMIQLGSDSTYGGP